MQTDYKKIPCISNDGQGPSVFGVRDVELNGSPSRMLSDQQSALNFRFRSSTSPYESDWHVAGDPTLLIILSGVVEIELRDGSTQRFGSGDLFIAQDHLLDGVEFNNGLGHRARIIGQDELQALHLKLDKQAR